MKKTIKITAETIRAYKAVCWAAKVEREKAVDVDNLCKQERVGRGYPAYILSHQDEFSEKIVSAALAVQESSTDHKNALNRFETLPEIVLLSEAIKAAEGRATARTITATDVVKYLADLTSDLDIPKKAMEGISVIVDVNGQRFPSAYKYTPESTQFSAEYKAGSWRIKDVYRFDCDPRKHELYLTDAAKDAIIDRITVRKA